MRKFLLLPMHSEKNTERERRTNKAVVQIARQDRRPLSHEKGKSSRRDSELPLHKARCEKLLSSSGERHFRHYNANPQTHQQQLQQQQLAIVIHQQDYTSTQTVLLLQLLYKKV